MQISRQARLTARLPATPCTPEMRDLIAQIAKEEKVKMADVQRHALQLFLDQIDSKTVNDDNKDRIQQEEKSA